MNRFRRRARVSGDKPDLCFSSQRRAAASTRRQPVYALAGGNNLAWGHFLLILAGWRLMRRYYRDLKPAPDASAKVVRQPASVSHAHGVRIRARNSRYVQRSAPAINGAIAACQRQISLKPLHFQTEVGPGITLRAAGAGIQRRAPLYGAVTRAGLIKPISSGVARI